MLTEYAIKLIEEHDKRVVADKVRRLLLKTNTNFKAVGSAAYYLDLFDKGNRSTAVMNELKNALNGMLKGMPQNVCSGGISADINYHGGYVE